MESLRYCKEVMENPHYYEILTSPKVWNTLQLFEKYEYLTATDVSDHLRISRPHVHITIKLLMKAGFIEEHRRIQEKPDAGPKPMQYRFKRNSLRSEKQ